MVKSIPLTGTETAVTGLDGAHAHIRNDGAEIIYAAKSAGLSAGADGVIAIPAGNAAALYGISGAVYISGAGAATVVTSDYVESPFKTSAQAGGSGADEVARAAISSHAGNMSAHTTESEKEKIHNAVSQDIFYAAVSGFRLDIGQLENHANNSDIHVTAEEKTAWSGKAEISDIPQKLQYVNYLGYVSDVENILDNTNYSDSAYECVITTSEAAQIGLPSCWWQIKYFRHTDNNGFGIQIAFPIDGPSHLPRYRTSLGSDWNDWKLMADGGNAASLQGHSSADFVLKSDYDALAERVSALEAGQI